MSLDIKTVKIALAVGAPPRTPLRELKSAPRPLAELKDRVGEEQRIGGKGKGKGWGVEEAGGKEDRKGLGRSNGGEDREREKEGGQGRAEEKCSPSFSS